jgi:hypothetical protein
VYLIQYWGTHLYWKKWFLVPLQCSTLQAVFSLAALVCHRCHTVLCYEKHVHCIPVWVKDKHRSFLAPSICQLSNFGTSTRPRRNLVQQQNAFPISHSIFLKGERTHLRTRWELANMPRRSAGPAERERICIRKYQNKKVSMQAFVK